MEQLVVFVVFLYFAFMHAFNAVEEKIYIALILHIYAPNAGR